MARAQEDEQHWAFVPPVRTSVPIVQRGEWTHNPIDHFILAPIESAGITPSPEASRPALLRRLCFDLTGLPPTPDQMRDFVTDARPDAYQRVVERLLASPSYGERWAQHWLDLARYADTDGYEFDAVRPDAWRYRDWVVRAFNDNMPYDRFVRLQLAGDEAEPGNADAFIATGFCRCYPDMVDQNDQALRRQTSLNDITETTALVFLGLTIGCARCHDHKIDPIPQADFYRLQAFFTPVRFRDDFLVNIEDERADYERALSGWKRDVGALEEKLAPAPEPQKGKLRQRLERLKKEGQPKPPQARGIDEHGDADTPTYILVRGQFGDRGPAVKAGVPTILSSEPIKAHGRGATSMRRSALADWLTAPTNPMTARVLVNRLWQHHFGRGLVGTPSDFGLGGDAPTHAELLDWLALEFVESGWDIKHVHRLIVTSATYRQSSNHNAERAEADPSELLIWRYPRHRLDGEAVRDAMLAASGRLNQTMGGPGVFPDLPQELAKLNAQGVAWPVSPNPEEHVRRSLYIFVRRNLRYPFFEAFDRPDTNASCPQRPRTTTAPQALSMLNGSIALESARRMALAVEAECPADRGTQIARCFERALGRTPDADERKVAEELFNSGGRLSDLCLALFNTNGFLYVD